jgi:hypothetical protein
MGIHFTPEELALLKEGKPVETPTGLSLSDVTKEALEYIQTLSSDSLTGGVDAPLWLKIMAVALLVSLSSANLRDVQARYPNATSVDNADCKDFMTVFNQNAPTTQMGFASEEHNEVIKLPVNEYRTALMKKVNKCKPQVEQTLQNNAEVTAMKLNAAVSNVRTVVKNTPELSFLWGALTTSAVGISKFIYSWFMQKKDPKPSPTNSSPTNSSPSNSRQPAFRSARSTSRARRAGSTSARRRTSATVTRISGGKRIYTQHYDDILQNLYTIFPKPNTPIRLHGGERCSSFGKWTILMLLTGAFLISFSYKGIWIVDQTFDFTERLNEVLTYLHNKLVLNTYYEDLYVFIIRTIKLSWEKIKIRASTYDWKNLEVIGPLYYIKHRNELHNLIRSLSYPFERIAEVICEGIWSKRAVKKEVDQIAEQVVKKVLEMDKSQSLSSPKRSSPDVSLKQASPKKSPKRASPTREIVLTKKQAQEFVDLKGKINPLTGRKLVYGKPTWNSLFDAAEEILGTQALSSILRR